MLQSEQTDLNANSSANNKSKSDKYTASEGNEANPSPQSDSNEAANKPNSPDELTVFTGALVLVGAIQAIVLWLTVVVTRASVRAYILARCENAEGIAASAKPRVVIILKNFGRSPAYRVRLYAKIDFAEYPMTHEPMLTYPGPYSSKMTITPGVEYGNPLIASTPLSREQLAEIADHKGQMFVYGKIRYKTLSMRRYTKFAFFILEGKEGKLPIMSPLGNDSN